MNAEHSIKNAKLPDMCYMYRPNGGPGRYIAVIRNGELGFFTSDIAEMNSIKAKELVEHMNLKLGVTPTQAGCMQVGSMFGWDVKGADPDYVEAQNKMNPFDLVADEENLFDA